MVILIWLLYVYNYTYLYRIKININHKFNYLLNKSSQLHVDFNYTSPIWCWLYVFLITMLHIFLRGGGHTEYILPTSASFNILLIRISNQRKQLLINFNINMNQIYSTNNNIAPLIKRVQSLKNKLKDNMRVSILVSVLYSLQILNRNQTRLKKRG